MGYNPKDISCPVCGYYCLGKGGHGCIDKPSLCGLEAVATDEIERLREKLRVAEETLVLCTTFDDHDWTEAESNQVIDALAKIREVK